MVAALPQLHHGVEEVGNVTAPSPSSSSGSSGSTSRCASFGQEGEVLLQDGAVVLLLDVGQLNLDKTRWVSRSLSANLTTRGC